MKRRDFVRRALTGASAAGGLAVTGLAGCAQESGQGPAVQTQPNVRWRLVSSFPRGLDTLYGSAEVLAAKLAAMSGGRFQIRTYPAGEIVPGLQVMDAVQQGTVQVGQTASYYFIGKNPALAFDACVPFGLTARQQAAWLHEGGGLEQMRRLFADFNILTFPAGNTGVQMGGWFKNEIQSVTDLQGLKMRIPGLGGSVMSRLGVTVQVLAGGDIFPALERGAIDATEWVGPYDDEKLGFHKVARNYYYPGWWEPGPSLSFYVNTDAWAKLPSAYQEMFVAAARDAESTMLARYDKENPPALARLIADGVQLRPFPPDVMEAAERASIELLEEEAAKDATYRQVYEAWKQFRKDAFRWFGTAELAYASYAFGS
jgi:TRAP-type mannitol/chloroaromatic compound transport system substrate-binding protein